MKTFFGTGNIVKLFQPTIILFFIKTKFIFFCFCFKLFILNFNSSFKNITVDFYSNSFPLLLQTIPLLSTQEVLQNSPFAIQTAANKLTTAIP